MQYPYFEFTVPVFTKMLHSVAHLLDKASELAATKEGGETAVLDMRIAPDMFPLSRQVQIACDTAKGVSARLADVSIPVFEDTETTIMELKERIEKTIAFLGTLTPEQFENAAAARIQLPYFPGKYLTGDAYLRQYGLANFYFHVTTMYDILRKEGVALSKSDYINGLPLIDLET